MPTPAVSDQQIAQLDRDGYFITDVLFGEAELLPIREELERFSRAMDENKTGGAFAYGMHAKSELCRRFLRHEAFAELCRELLGPDVYQTWNQMIVKKPGTSGSFAWHQDGYYGAFAPDGSRTADAGPMAPSETLTFWVALTDATVENGCLWALPGMHDRGFLSHEWNEAGQEWVGTYDTADRIPVELAAGQALVFTRLTPHCSGANTTDGARIGYQIGYATEPGVNDRVAFLRDGSPV